jgi:hypothetical protein
MELGGRATYHAKAVPVRDKKITEHKMLLHRPIRLDVLGTGLCSCVLLPFSPENLENSGILAPCGYGTASNQ